MSEELKPCPFCGAGETRISEARQWTGMVYSEPISVSVRHWCTPVDGQPSRMIERIGRDHASAVAAWNRRTVSGQEAIYQVISRGVCQDVTKDQYDACEGKRYERRIVCAAPIPATELSDDDLRKLAFKHCYATTDANGWIFAAELDRGLRDFARAILAAAKDKP